MIRERFDRFAGVSSDKAGSPIAFGLACGVLIVWAVSGPVFGFSDTWQLIINTGTTIVTFLMVFLLQHTQNKDARALQIKLDTLIAATETASNRMIDIEDLDADELEAMRRRYAELARRSPRFDELVDEQPLEPAAPQGEEIRERADAEQAVRAGSGHGRRAGRD